MHDPTLYRNAFAGPTPSHDELMVNMQALRETMMSLTNATPWTAYQESLRIAVRQLWAITEFLVYQYENDPVRQTIKQMEQDK